MESFATYRKQDFPSSLDLLKPYFETSSNVFICPGDFNGSSRQSADGSSYLFNEYLCVSGTGTVLNRAFITNASSTIVVFPASD
jgi:hypothetical protein